MTSDPHETATRFERLGRISRGLWNVVIHGRNATTDPEVMATCRRIQNEARERKPQPLTERPTQPEAKQD